MIITISIHMKTKITATTSISTITFTKLPPPIAKILKGETKKARLHQRTTKKTEPEGLLCSPLHHSGGDLDAAGLLALKERTAEGRPLDDDARVSAR